MMISANGFLDSLLSDAEVRAEYERLAPEYEAVRELLMARKRAKLTQEEVAIRMGTTKSAVARLESAEHKPSIRSLERYAAATGHRLQWRLVPDDAKAL